ncbi:hypothetical protein C1752_16677 [Acaryochloris thomasi RCC1774]|uniref:Uncharacterized protein n=1 Tax=Acaryochloris thomasi RCC1774 TaxID=1764569 RepID=A0A2W1J6E6_9CYAN|nr:hypothetical protein [Acaryochloris thomasi]PZD70213.1 hypothetical protein C1752_16677 [Acaryochloris thomasi RCC1774]
MQAIKHSPATHTQADINLELLPETQRSLISSLLANAAQAKPQQANELLWKAVKEMSRTAVLSALRGEEQRLCHSIEELRSQLKTLAGKVKKHQKQSTTEN